MRARTLCLVSVALAGCVPDFSTDLSQLREPRLLAVAADPPEAAPNKPVTLTALVAVPEGTTAPRLDWSLCQARKSLTELGPVNPACLGLAETNEAPAGDAGALIPLGSGESARAQLDKDVCKLFGPLRPPPMMGQAAGRPVDPDVTGGFYQPVVATLGDVPSLGSIRIDCDPANVDRDDALAYRRLYRVNENPRISSLALGSGDSLSELDEERLPELKAGSRLDLRAAWPECPATSECGDGYCTADEDAMSCPDDCTLGQAHGCAGAEAYVWYNRQVNRIEPRREAISVAWYTSSGHFDSEQTGLDEAQSTATRFTDNVWYVGATSGRATVWVVIRDSRGGQSWRTLRFNVAP